MKLNLFLVAALLAVEIVLLVVGGWFGLLVGVVALLMALVLLTRTYRLRSARS
jgi:succinate-acetate transporter protein